MSFIEKRAYPRITIMMQADYEKDGQNHECTILNISRKGIAFASDGVHKVGDKVEFEISLGKPLKLCATVVRIENVEDGRYKYLYGATMEANPDSVLVDYIDEKMAELKELYGNTAN